MKFSGKNVLITGSSRGIGRAIANVLSSFGLKVWINYLNSKDSADELKDSIEATGREVGVIKFDASCESQFSKAIKAIVECDGELSYLVNNAGIISDKLSIRIKKRDFENIIRHNLTSSFIGCKEALKVMSKKRFGSVVNISSVVADCGNMGQVSYSASKGGINSMTKSFVLEGSLRGIRFNVVSPGYIATDMTNTLDEKTKKLYLEHIPLSKFGVPKDVGYAVAFLLSDYSSYITGDNLRVNGGLYIG